MHVHSQISSPHDRLEKFNIFKITSTIIVYHSITAPMNFFRFGVSSGPWNSIRSFSQAATVQDKYYKILRYVKPIDTTVYKEGDELPKGKHIPYYKPTHPQYKYETNFFKRQNRGLFGGLQRSRSKTCSPNGKNKNLRFHLPNIVKTKLWSETLNRQIQTHVTTSVLKTITKEGGLDAYLTKDKPARVKTLGLKGWKLRYEILKKREFNELGFVNDRKVYYIHPDGLKITVGRRKLLQELYPLVYKDNYYPITWDQFLKAHTVLSTKEMVDKLQSYNYDFSSISA